MDGIALHYEANAANPVTEGVQQYGDSVFIKRKLARSVQTFMIKRYLLC